MTKPDELRIELHASGCTFSLLSHEEDQWIRKWIDYDEDIHKLASWFKRFYTTFDQIEACKKNKSDNPSIVHLKPKKTTPPFTTLSLLTAQMPVIEANDSKQKLIKTFVSEAHKTILRLLHNEHDQQLNLHVISNYVGRDDIVLLRVNKGDQLLVSEPGGSFHFSDTKTDIDISLEKIANWRRCQLYLAVDKIRLYKDKNTGEINFDTTELRSDREALNLTCTSNELQVTFLPGFNDKEHPQRVVFNSGRQSKDIEINAGVCSIPLDTMSGSQACLHFYDV